MFSNMSLVPRVISSVEHRSDVSLKCDIGGMILNPPFILSPMPDCSSEEFCAKFAKLGGMALLHRFQTIDNQRNAYASAIGRLYDTPKAQLGCAIGVTGDYKERFKELFNLGCRTFVLDVANGGSQKVLDAIKWLNRDYPNLYLIVGNVNSHENFNTLASFDIIRTIRVSIGSGQNCTSTIETGIARLPENLMAEISNPLRKTACWDGGLKTPGDCCKALALGCGSLMLGSVFAACSDSPAKTYKLDGKLYKVLRGNASYSTQQESWGLQPTYVEGSERLVPMGESLEKTMQRFINGIKSCCSYFNAFNLDEFRKNVTYEYNHSCDY